MKKINIFITLLIAGLSWLYIKLYVDTEAASRKITATVILEMVSNRVIEVDNRIFSTLKEYSLDNRADGVFLLTQIDDDFSLVDRKEGVPAPADLGAMYYPVNTTKGDYYLRIENRYFLENSRMLTKYSRDLSGYAILGVPKELELDKKKLRSAINLDDNNYFRYRVIDDTSSPYNLVLVAYIDKPPFHRLIYPNSFTERVTLSLLLLSCFMLITYITSKIEFNFHNIRELILRRW